MKTERVTLLTTPHFKAFLGAEAQRAGISVGELIRNRFETKPSAEEAALAALTVELNQAVAQASRALADGLAQAQATLRELRAAPSVRRKPARVRA